MNNLKCFLLNGYQEYNHLMGGMQQTSAITSKLRTLLDEEKKKGSIKALNNLKINPVYKLQLAIITLIIPIYIELKESTFKDDLGFRDMLSMRPDAADLLTSDSDSLTILDNDKTGLKRYINEKLFRDDDNNIIRLIVELELIDRLNIDQQNLEFMVKNYDLNTFIQVSSWLSKFNELLEDLIFPEQSKPDKYSKIYKHFVDSHDADHLDETYLEYGFYMSHFYYNFVTKLDAFTQLKVFFTSNLHGVTDFSKILDHIYNEIESLFSIEISTDDSQFIKLILDNDLLNSELNGEMSLESNILSISGIIAYMIYHENNNLDDPFAAQT